MAHVRAVAAPAAGTIAVQRGRLGARMLSISLAALVVLIAGTLLRPAPRADVSAGRVEASGPPASLAAASATLGAAVSSTLGAERAAYHVRPAAGGLVAHNPAQGIRARFARSGLAVSTRTVGLTIDLGALGYGSELHAVPRPVPTATANRVLYTAPGVSQWYVNGPLGLEQGFTVERAPTGPVTGPLTLALPLTPDGRLSMSAGAVLIRRGGSSLVYSGLRAQDARGRPLRSWMVLRGRRLLLRVDARHARYPLRIDPFIQQGGKLTGSGESEAAAFGFSVALSGDGNTALVGGREDNKYAGAAWVFVRSGGLWSQQGGKLTGGGEVGHSRFGVSVALSGDGNTALIGGDEDNGSEGAAWVFTRSGGVWSQQGGKLTGAGESGKPGFGDRVALSGDGNTALIGGSGDNGLVGAAWVFTRSGGVWSQQGPKLTGAGESGSGWFGSSVAVSEDGNTALVGAERDGMGAAYVFTRSGGTWSQQGAKLTGAGEGAGGFGFSVALSGDGNTALIGDAGENSNVGAAWVFTRSGGVWSQQGGKLTGAGESLARGLAPSGKAARIAGILAANALTLSFAATVPGSLAIDVYQVPAGATLTKRMKPKRVLVAAGALRIAAPRTAKLKLKLTGAGRRLLKHARRIKLTAQSRFTPDGMSPITVIGTFTLKR